MAKPTLNGSPDPADETGGSLELPERARGIRLGNRGAKQPKVRFTGYKKVMRVLQDGKKPKRAGRRGGGQLNPPRPLRIYSQRVAVRLTYARNKSDGTWQAHGRYLERESAAGRDGDGRGFGSDGPSVPIAKTLDVWQKAEDRHMFKLIVSPENGADLDLRAFTTEYMGRLEKELGTKLQWVGVDHHNTDNPHAHVALRGRDQDGNTLVIPREFIRGPLRNIAGDLATAKLGHRTHRDLEDARAKQVTQHRWTDLDRVLKRVGQGGVIDFSTPVAAHASEDRKQRRQQLLQRLAVLEGMGLAKRGEGGRWVMDPAAETILRERQKANDRLKALHSHKAVVSDPRLPLTSAPEGAARISGRLLGTGLDDATGKPYMLLESLGGSVIYLYQTSSAERAAGQGMKAGDYVVVNQRERPSEGGRTSTMLDVRAFGPAEQALTDKKILRSELRHHIDRTGAAPQPSTFGGWLGAFHGKLADEAIALQARGVITEQAGRLVMERPEPARKSTQARDRSR